MALWLLWGSAPLLMAQFDLLIRNHVPAAWQAEKIRWCRDVQPRNKVEDAIDGSLETRFDVIVNFKRCVTDNDVAMLNGPAGQNRVQMRSRYLATVFVAGLSKAEIREFAALPDIAFIEQQHLLELHLNTSLSALCVTPGPCSPNTVQEQFAAINGNGVNIAIIDSGVDDGLHDTLPGSRFVAGYNAITMAFENPNDVLFHGTHVASIALGQAGAVVGRGVAPAAGLIDVKVTDTPTFPPTRICDALETVYDNRAAWNVRVINMSLGDATSSDGLEAVNQLVDLAEAMGIVVVISSGNNGPANVGIGSPGAATRAITVAAVETMNTAARGDDAIACFSNRGPRAGDGDGDTIDELKPEVAAPGTHLDVTVPTCTLGAGTGILAARWNTANGSIRLEGTSMAAPHVAGIAALILQARAGINPASVKDLIISTATPIGPASLPGVDPVWNNASGWGEVNAFAAINRATVTDLTFPSYPPSPGWLSPDITTASAPKVGVANTVTVQVRNAGPNPATAARVHFGVHVFSAATPTFFDIGTRIVNLPVGITPVSCPWTPQAASHQCLKVEIGYGPDTDYSNNSAQRNVTVQMSPVTFEVRNTLTEERTAIELVIAQEGTNGPGQTNWTVVVEPRQIVLGAMDCAQVVRAELFPGPNVPAGERRRAHIAAIIRTPFGPVQLGGISFDAIKAVRPDITRQPRSQEVPCGGTATFIVAAAGTDPLTYQWRFNGSALPGANSPMLTLANVGPANEGAYSVEVSNPAGNAFSSSASLRVIEGPPPVLSIARQGDQASISWPQTCPEYVLEETPAFRFPLEWSPANASVDTVGGRHLANITIRASSRFFRLARLGTNQISFQPPALAILKFDDLDLTQPPTPVDAKDIVEVPWTALPGSLTDELEARLRQVALLTPVVREVLGTRFAFLSASQEEPIKDLAGTNDITRLLYFSHDRNVAVEVFMRGLLFSDVTTRPNDQPAEGADEVAAAADLARRDDRLRDRVVGLVADGILQVIETRGQPGFGNRVIYVTFSKGDLEENPLYTALVDLTTETVLSVQAHGR